MDTADSAVSSAQTMNDFIKKWRVKNTVERPEWGPVGEIACL